MRLQRVCSPARSFVRPRTAPHRAGWGGPSGGPPGGCVCVVVVGEVSSKENLEWMTALSTTAYQVMSHVASDVPPSADASVKVRCGGTERVGCRSTEEQTRGGGVLSFGRETSLALRLFDSSILQFFSSSIPRVIESSSLRVFE